MTIKDFQTKLIAGELGIDASKTIPVGEHDTVDGGVWIVTAEKPDGTCVMGVIEIREELHMDALAADFGNWATEQGGDCGHATNMADESVIYFGSNVDRVRQHMEFHKGMSKKSRRKGFGN